MELKKLLIKIINIFGKEFGSFPIHEVPELSTLTVVQAHYLETISIMENPTISTITKELNVTKPTASVIVDKLVQLGYIFKEHSNTDRRIYYLRLSEKGKELYAIYRYHEDKGYDAFIIRMKKVLGEKDVKKFTEILKKLADNL